MVPVTNTTPKWVVKATVSTPPRKRGKNKNKKNLPYPSPPPYHLKENDRLGRSKNNKGRAERERDVQTDKGEGKLN